MASSASSVIQYLTSPQGPLFVIAGPCVIESAEICLKVGRRVKDICQRLGLPYVFKASFDKANRSSSSSFRGPGMVDGLVVLERIRAELDVPVLTDVHEAEQAQAVAEVVDILQVPAFLARQTDLLVACGHTGKAVNIKKGQLMAPAEMENAVKKVRMVRKADVAIPGPTAGKDAPILLTERGTFFGYNRLVNDFTGLAIMRETRCPIVFDITHSTQQPAALGNQSGGNPQFAPLLARAAVAAGVNGLFLECHPDPRNARSDPATMLGLDEVEMLLTQAKDLADCRKKWEAS